MPARRRADTRIKLRRSFRVRKDYNPQKATDLEVFALAAEKDRILVSANTDFWHLVDLARAGDYRQYSAPLKCPDETVCGKPVRSESRMAKVATLVRTSESRGIGDGRPSPMARKNASTS